MGVDMGIVVIHGQGELTVGGVDLVRPGGGELCAWTALDLSRLWEDPDTRGGVGTIIPGEEGREPNPRNPDETTYRLPFHVTGAVDRNGAPHANPIMGLALNIKYLRENVVDLTSTTKAAVLEMPDGSFLEADVQVSIVYGDLQGAYDKPADLFVKVSKPGYFVEAGS